MQLTYATIAVLASMIFVLSAMVGYVYWQQTRMLQHIQSLALALATHVEHVRQLQQPPSEPEQSEEEEEVDDRVSVKEPVEIVEGPPPTATTPDEDDTDDLQDKTSSQLRELLTKKGIPFGKRDSKTVLLQLLKATA
jgi:hypothetical protein